MVTRHPSNDNVQASSAGNEHTESADPSFVIVSGGTGCNAICSAFSNACYVLPVSDDGGSSSEIIRVLGGPSIGDIRSRLVRLIPPAPPGSPLDALRILLAYRLPVGAAARDEWRAIVEGKSPLWNGVPNDRKEAIRGFLVYFENEVLRRAHKSFSFVNGSIGNYFLAASQGFFRSLPSAIFLFSSITSSQANILPVIVTNHIVTIAAELNNGAKLIGQCEISHPVPRITFNPEEVTRTDHTGGENTEDDFDVMSPTGDADGDGGEGSILPRNQNVMFSATSKDNHEEEELEAPISRLYYINSYGHEIHPSPNPDYIKSLARNEVLVYSCGSLWTSIIPCLALRGVSTAIARSHSLRAKVLFLNSKNDRETTGYTAVDYIQAIVRTLNARYQVEPYGLARGNAATLYPVSAFITHLVYIRGTTVKVDVRKIADMGVRCIEVESSSRSSSGTPVYDAECARTAVDEVLSSVT
ncbi:UPF0052-domain-containing protein [Stereum hirsutum FP-91666 SS1]|uniref:UPF0052-domain-containing protein n=1 Tax=Stereum hirsutum (strain FP-91666) TaxID=721885 RepID=UPI000440E412|nr:UPF0052-domain-containing protein [Stereum hirsutum FP-91666 SS1]EIM91900.1 UPF0052-domain-containing protein [Stereum hirsutum FP-91666 SS1]